MDDSPRAAPVDILAGEYFVIAGDVNQEGPGLAAAYEASKDRGFALDVDTKVVQVHLCLHQLLAGIVAPGTVEVLVPAFGVRSAAEDMVRLTAV